MRETVYTPESRLLRPRQLWREMRDDALGSRELAWRLLLRNIRVQYRGSLLGAAWAFIPAAATATILTFASGSGIISVGETELPYPAYVFFSMTLWQAFLESLNGPVHALTAEMSMLSKFNVAPEAVVMSKLGEAVFNFAVRSLLTIVLFIWYWMPIGPSVLLAPVGVGALMLLGAGLGLTLAPFNGIYPDVSKGLPIVTSFWFFLTPIIYPPPAEGVFALVVGLNPVTPLLVTTRELTLGNPLSSAAGFAVSVIITAALLLVGWVVCRVAMPIVLERARV